VDRSRRPVATPSSVVVPDLHEPPPGSLHGQVRLLRLQRTMARRAAATLARHNTAAADLLSAREPIEHLHRLPEIEAEPALLVAAHDRHRYLLNQYASLGPPLPS
jgi:hypothetical protein